MKTPSLYAALIDELLMQRELEESLPLDTVRIRRLEAIYAELRYLSTLLNQK